MLKTKRKEFCGSVKSFKSSIMKKFIDFIVFMALLSVNLIIVFMFALTGSLSMLVLLPFGIITLMLTLQNSSLS